MDFLYHIVMGIEISHMTTNTYEPMIIISSMLPDIIGATPSEINIIRRTRKDSPKVFIKDLVELNKSDYFYGNVEKVLYPLTHSLTGILISGIAFSILLPPDLWKICTIAYAMHITIDLMTHKGEQAFRPFYPFSNSRVELPIKANYVANKKLFLGMWFMLATFIAARRLFF
jgi:hypothetical protein